MAGLMPAVYYRLAMAGNLKQAILIIYSGTAEDEIVKRRKHANWLLYAVSLLSKANI